jgi:hypothetical protein
LHLLATGLSPAICLQKTIVLQPSSFLYSSFQFRRYFFEKGSLKIF